MSEQNNDQGQTEPAIAFESIDGAMRVRIEEEAWERAWTQVGRPAQESVVQPLVPLDQPGETDGSDVSAGAGAEHVVMTDAVAEAIALSRGDGALVRLELNTFAPPHGILAGFGTDGQSGAGAVRVLTTDDPEHEGEALPVPGIELSAFGIEDWVANVVRLFPPDPEIDVPEDLDRTLSLPTPVAMLIGKATAEGDQATMDKVVAEQGWQEVPPLMASLSQGIFASATLTMTVAGNDGIGLRRWLMGSLGWVGLEPTESHIEHRLCSREEVAGQLAQDISAALQFAANTEAGSGPSSGRGSGLASGPSAGTGARQE